MFFPRNPAKISKNVFIGVHMANETQEIRRFVTCKICNFIFSNLIQNFKFHNLPWNWSSQFGHAKCMRNVFCWIPVDLPVLWMIKLLVWILLSSKLFLKYENKKYIDKFYIKCHSNTWIRQKWLNLVMF